MRNMQVMRVHHAKVPLERTHPATADAARSTHCRTAPLESVAGTDGDHGEANALQLLAVKHESSAAGQSLSRLHTQR